VSDSGADRELKRGTNQPAKAMYVVRYLPSHPSYGQRAKRTQPRV
jgi:hypothetical protein